MTKQKNSPPKVKEVRYYEMEITSDVSHGHDLDLEVEGHSLSAISVNVYGSPVAGTRASRDQNEIRRDEAIETNTVPLNRVMSLARCNFISSNLLQR